MEMMALGWKMDLDNFKDGIYDGQFWNEKYNTMDLDLPIEVLVCTCRAYAIINKYVLTLSHIIKQSELFLRFKLHN